MPLDFSATVNLPRSALPVGLQSNAGRRASRTESLRHAVYSFVEFLPGMLVPLVVVGALTIVTVVILGPAWR